jgi:hypothetical protein
MIDLDSDVVRLAGAWREYRPTTHEVFPFQNVVAFSEAS